MASGWPTNTSRAMSSQVEMAVPPSGCSCRAISTASARVLASALASSGGRPVAKVGGYMHMASWLPEMTANQVPSGSSSSAAARAWRAARILVDGWPMDPLVSTMRTTAFSCAMAGAAAPSPLAEVTVTTAWTSVESAGRYSFW